MSAQQQESKKINTSCKDCLFAKYNNDTQTGCEFNRIEKFSNVIEAYDNDKEFFVVPRFCNYYRNSSWNNGYKDKNLAARESAVTFDILFDFNNVTDQFLANIQNLLEYNQWGDDTKILDVTVYDQNKLNYAIYHNEISKENRKIIAQFYASHPNISLTVNKANDNLFIHDKLMKTNKTYHVILNSDSIFDKDMILQVNDLINNNLKQALLIKHNNVLVVSNLAYKINAHQNENSSILYNENIQDVVQSIMNTKLYFEI